MKYEINNQVKARINKKVFNQVIQKFRKRFKLNQDLSLSLALVEPKTIKRLNRLYRGQDKVTDVLSFGEQNGGREDFISPEVNLGEIIICYDQARRQAKEAGHSLSQELKILLVHGLLHLVGYDHKTKKEREKMSQEEVELIR